MRLLSLVFLLVLLPQLASAGNREGIAAEMRRDYATAVREWQPLAEQGNADAQVHLGLLYLLGQGVLQDFQRAFDWYRKAAEQDHVEASFRLGLMYANGEGIPRDMARARYWRLKAVELGEPIDFWYFGLICENGRLGLPIDYVCAAYWHTNAAEKGYEAAQISLAWLYAAGKGRPKDLVRAYAWFNIAAAQSNFAWFSTLERAAESAAESRARLVEKMTREQVAEGQQLSRELGNRIESGSTVVETPSQSSSSRTLTAEVQRELKTLKYNPGPADGITGPRTVAAVRAFQRDMGNAQTGAITDELLSLLKIAVAAAKAMSDGVPETKTPYSSGSGFFVSASGHAITNHHVIEDCKSVVIPIAGKDHRATIAAKDAHNDLALLQVPMSTSGAALFRRSRAALGESVTVAGYPLAGLLTSDLNVTTGTISAIAGPEDDARLVQVTAPVQPGNSGGPLLDKSGNVIGVVVSKLNAIKAARITGDIPQNVNFAIKGAVVRSFLDIHGLEYQLAESRGAMQGEQVAARAREFTVPVTCYR